MYGNGRHSDTTINALVYHSKEAVTQSFRFYAETVKERLIHVMPASPLDIVPIPLLKQCKTEMAIVLATINSPVYHSKEAVTQSFRFYAETVKGFNSMQKITAHSF